MGNASADVVLLNINDCLIGLQSIIKCGICCSTLRSPVTPSCNHAFCKECLDAVFQRRTSIECPVCRQTITKRSARTPSEHISLVVTNYLQLVRNFKREIKDAAPLPKDRVILESQAITQIGETPIRSTVFQEPFIMKRKKRKNEGQMPVKNKMMKIIKEEEPMVFQVPEMRQANPIVEESSESSITPPPSPARNSPILTMKYIKKEPIDEKVTVQEGHEAAQVPLSNPPMAETIPQKIFLEEKPLITSTPTALPRKITKNVKIGTELLTFPMAIQCSLFPSDLNEAIKQQKMEEPTLTDISAFFSIFPTARELFKSNLPILLRELGMRPYFSNNEEVDRTMKFEVPITEEGSFLSDHDATIPMVNPSRMSLGSLRKSNIFSKPTAESGCQTDEIVEEEKTKKTISTMCQTDPEPCTSDCSFFLEDAKDSSFERSHHTLRTINSSHKSSRRASRLSTLSNKENNPNRYDSDEDVFADNSTSFVPEPKDYIISISRKIGPEDNLLLREFRTLCGVKVQTDIGPDCTHLVMMNGTGPNSSNKQSLKYIFAVAKRIEIVKREWIEDCLQAKQLLATKDYLYEAEQSIQHLGSKSKAHSFLRKLRCYIPEKYFNHEELLSRNIPPAMRQFQTLIQLIKWCGGEVSSHLMDFKRRNQSEDLSKKESKSVRIIIFSSFCEEPQAARFLTMDLRVPVVKADFILDSIARRELLEVDGYLVQE